MAKRKRSRKGRAPVGGAQRRKWWSEKDLEKLLAFLDYSIGKSMRPDRVNEEAAQYLTEKCGNGEFSLTEVREKIRWFWDEFGPDYAAADLFEEIYKRGSKILSWPKAEQKEKIALQTKIITHEKRLDYFESPMKTRSGAEVFGRGTASPSRLRSGSASSATTLRGTRAGQEPREQSRKRRVLKSSGLGVSGHSPPRLPAELTKTQDRGALSPLGRVNPIKLEDSFTIFETPTHPRSSSSESPQFQSAETSHSPSPAVFAPPPALLLSTSAEDDVTAVGEPQDSTNPEAMRIQELRLELQQMETARALEVDFWKARCKSAETDRARLKTVNTAFTVRLGDLIQKDQKLGPTQIAIYEARIWNLEEQVDAFHQSERLAASEGLELPKDTVLDITKSMKRIGSRLRRAFEGQECHACSKLLIDSEAGELSTLAEKVFNTGSMGSGILEIPDFLTPGLTKQMVLRSFSGAAIAEWVFDGARRGYSVRSIYW